MSNKGNKCNQSSKRQHSRHEMESDPAKHPSLTITHSLVEKYEHVLCLPAEQDRVTDVLPTADTRACLTAVFRDFHPFTEICSRPCHFPSSGFQFFVFEPLLLMQASCCMQVCCTLHQHSTAITCKMCTVLFIH